MDFIFYSTLQVKFQYVSCPRMNKFCKLVVLEICIASRMTQHHVMFETARIGDVIFGVPHVILAWLDPLRLQSQ
jgi:hypothetical protein